MSASLLTDYVLGRAAERGDKPAVIDAATDETITFAELPERIEQASRALHHQGLRSGMYAAVRMPNGPHLPVVQHAILSLGAVTVSLNALTSEVETGAAMAQTGADLLICEPPGALDVVRLPRLERVTQRGALHWSIIALTSEDRRIGSSAVTSCDHARCQAC